MLGLAITALIIGVGSWQSDAAAQQQAAAANALLTEAMAKARRAEPEAEPEAGSGNTITQPATLTDAAGQTTGTIASTESGGSDLHMSSGVEPMMRLHGGLRQAVEGDRPLGSADLERMFMEIAPKPNREQFAAENDTDFAYEIQGLARFRCNSIRAAMGLEVIHDQQVGFESFFGDSP